MKACEIFVGYKYLCFNKPIVRVNFPFLIFKCLILSSYKLTDVSGVNAAPRPFLTSCNIVVASSTST